MVIVASGRYALSKIRVNDDKTVKPSSMTVHWQFGRDSTAW